MIRNSQHLIALVCWLFVSILPAQAARLLVFPSRLDLAGPGDRHALIVVRIGETGQRTDVTASAHFQSEQDRVVTVANSGEIYAAAVGETTVQVAACGLTAEVPVTVANGNLKSAVSFAMEVLPTMHRLGCSTSGCHGSEVSSAGLRLATASAESIESYRWITRDFGGRYISKIDPAQSLLLQKPLGKSPHKGGVVLNPNQPEYATIKSWLERGTPSPDPLEAPIGRLAIILPIPVASVGEQLRLMARAETGMDEWVDVSAFVRWEVDNGLEWAGFNVVKARRPGWFTIRSIYRGKSIESWIMIRSGTRGG